MGHFPETIKDGFNGYLVEPDNIDDMVRKMNHFIENPINRDNVASAKEKMSWANYAAAIMKS